MTPPFKASFDKVMSPLTLDLSENLALSFSTSVSFDKAFLPTLLMFFLLLGSFNYAQEVVDNIESQYKKTTQNTPERFLMAGKYAQTLFYNDQKEKAFNILRQNIAFSVNYEDGQYASFLYAIIAINHYLEKNYQASDNNILKAVYYSERTNNNNAKGYVKYAQGWLSVRKNKEAEGVKFFIDALKYYDKSPSSTVTLTRLASVYTELTSIYANQNDYPLQEKYSKLSLELAKKQINTLKENRR